MQRESSLSIVLYRILGNDLPPLHRSDQTYANLKFILDYEPALPHCQKKWVVNRIVSSRMERRIIDLLECHGQSHIRIPFDFREYRRCVFREIADEGALGYSRSAFGRERHKKILYVMNINGARNLALRDGKKMADWILPLDGNSCFTVEGWRGVIEKLLEQKSDDACFVVPYYRLGDNKQFFNFDPSKEKQCEPQIIFGKNTTLEFNKSYRYGYRDKVELLERIFKQSPSPFSYLTFWIENTGYNCGYAIRLSSGVQTGEGGGREKWRLREKGIGRMLSKIDRLLVLRSALDFLKFRIVGKFRNA